MGLRESFSYLKRGVIPFRWSLPGGPLVEQPSKFGLEFTWGKTRMKSQVCHFLRPHRELGLRFRVMTM